MEKNRLFILGSSALAVIGVFLPWVTASVSAFGNSLNYNVNGIEGDGKIILVLSIVAAVLAVLGDIKQGLSKRLSLGIVVLGALEALVLVVLLINFGHYSGQLGQYGASLSAGIGLGLGYFIDVIGAVGTIVAGLLAFSGGRISRETFAEAGQMSKQFATTVGHATTSAVKSATNEFKKDAQEPTSTPVSEEVVAPTTPAQPVVPPQTLEQEANSQGLPTEETKTDAENSVEP
ncbi:hypothetical protein [Streptococcus sp. DD13]|uniref:hypothetical protein n=1 Tax=Streptococcus sp. DD13 TaxID=1777881 RepID=UPI00079557FD|nr:hypothetical protein [Streptococcus sp. DD13]KXT77275.1 hypothetical protein STRDD13_01565 [Streptococcus sp. DD13]